MRSGLVFCSNCGSQVADESKFCSGCGRTVGAPNTTPAQTPPTSEGKEAVLQRRRRTHNPNNQASWSRAQGCKLALWRPNWICRDWQRFQENHQGKRNSGGDWKGNLLCRKPISFWQNFTTTIIGTFQKKIHVTLDKDVGAGGRGKGISDSDRISVEIEITTDDIEGLFKGLEAARMSNVQLWYYGVSTTTKKLWIWARCCRFRL